MSAAGRFPCGGIGLSVFKDTHGCVDHAAQETNEMMMTKSDRESPNLFKLLRIAHGMSIADVCQRTSLSQSYVSELERGKKVPSLKTLEVLGAMYHMKPSALMRLAETLPEGSDVTVYQNALLQILTELTRHNRGAPDEKEQ